jgi:hypothetical protein
MRGEYRWEGAAGTSFFVDPRDDMFTLIMGQAPSQGGRLITALRTLIYCAREKGLERFPTEWAPVRCPRKHVKTKSSHGISLDHLAIE